MTQQALTIGTSSALATDKPYRAVGRGGEPLPGDEERRTGGAKLDAIADQLGHASTDTTRIYARIVDRMTENPAKFLEAMLTAQATV